jgi:flagellar biosynthetic protein FliP
MVGTGCALLAGTFLFLNSTPASSAPVPQIDLPDISIGVSPEAAKRPLALPLQMLMLMTILSLAPYILVMTTSFIRITIVLSFLRTAMGTQQVPPTQVLMGLGLFMTLYIMMPVGSKINNEALKPYLQEKIPQKVFFQKASEPIKDFMLRQTRDKDLYLFVKLAKVTVASRKNVPLHVLLPAFVISEIKTAFEIGFLLYIPFLVVDMVVSSVLMSMGMFMLSPMTISLPFKLLLFVMIDGWQLIVDGLVRSFK